ncbi:LLM class flavin-dependent oxidoreductase [Kitasatospora sp. NPDC018058]|uniref:LLM class flavin-dependent oxidoreductase n=1 Tax=Kitasatospora sp. NPDC018058 TaxID=3364025 RepID=UPI0037C163BB
MSGPDGRPLRHALLLPNAGHYADPARLVEYAVRAEESGWDGLFLWDHLMLHRELRLPVADTWTAVTAVLARTRRLVSGPLVTPLARRRPWKVARESATLDRLSGGRLVLGVGLGAVGDLDFAAFGEEGGLRERAARVDESLEVLAGLWRGTEFSHQGPHYRVDRATFLPTPVADPHGRGPRVPVWGAATWPAAGSGALRRAAALDGVVPMVRAEGGGLRGPEADELAAILRRMDEVGSRPGPAGREVAAVAVAAPGDPDAARAQSAALAAAGATWRLESFDPWRRTPRDLAEWLAAGPPRTV